MYPYMCVGGNIIIFSKVEKKKIAILRDVHIHLYCKIGECAR